MYSYSLYDDGDFIAKSPSYSNPYIAYTMGVIESIEQGGFDVVVTNKRAKVTLDSSKTEEIDKYILSLYNFENNE